MKEQSSNLVVSGKVQVEVRAKEKNEVLLYMEFPFTKLEQLDLIEAVILSPLITGKVKDE